MIYLNDAPVPAQHQASVRDIPAAPATPASFICPKQAERPDTTVPSSDAAPAKQEACQQPPQQPELIVLDDSSDEAMPEQASLGRNKAAAEGSWGADEGLLTPGGKRRGARGKLQGPCNHCFAQGLHTHTYPLT